MRSLIGVALSATLLITGLAGTSLAQEPAPSDDPAPSAEPAASPLPDASPDVAAAVEVAPMPGFRDARWRRVDQANAPDPREDHTLTVDDAGDYAYLFAGRDGRREFADLWRLNLETERWRRLRPEGRTPDQRFGHNAVWLPGQGLVVFAGQQGVDFLNDVWLYDPERERWRKLPDRGAVPRERYGSCAVIDADGKLRISHGFTFAGRFDDTRTYDFERERWADVTPDGRLPGERCLHDCFTNAVGDIVLYGGQDDTNRALGDVWAQRPNGTWRSLGEARPRARNLPAVTDAGRNAYIFGGAAANGDKLGDTWRVDRDTLRFSRVRTTGATPPARSAGTLIADTKRQRLLLWGGEANAARADLWELIDRTAPTTEEPAGDAGEEPVAENDAPTDGSEAADDAAPEDEAAEAS